MQPAQGPLTPQTSREMITPIGTVVAEEETVSTSPQPPARLASEDVIINAPMSYAGSAQRIMRLRRRAQGGGPLVAITVLAVLLVLVAWVIVTAWYLVWGV